MEGDANERPELEWAQSALLTGLLQALAGQIEASGEPIKLGILGPGGSGRSRFIGSLCQHLMRRDPGTWMVLNLDCSTYRSAVDGGRPSYKTATWVAHALAHSLLHTAAAGTFPTKAASLAQRLVETLLYPLRFNLYTRRTTWFILLLSIFLLVTLIPLVKWEVLEALPLQSVSLLELGGFLGFAGMLVFILRQAYALMRITAESLDASDVAVLLHLRGNPVFGRHKRIIVVAEGFHACAAGELPKLVEALHAVLGSMPLHVIYELDPVVTLAAFAADYHSLGQYQQHAAVQQLARERLSRLLDLPVNLAELSPQCRSPLPAGCEPPFRPLSEQQARLFAKWCGHFGFSNPRQIHRMFCSYQLLRHLYGDEGSISKGDSLTLDHFTADISCPKLITLCALEYINDHPDPLWRVSLLAWMARARQRGFTQETEPTLADLDVAGRLSEALVGTVNEHGAWIKPFVLPALATPLTEVTTTEANPA